MNAQTLHVAQAGARRTRLWLAVVLLTCARLLAQPYGLNYQARVTDPATGEPRAGVITFTFRLYDAPEGGAALWMETKDVAVIGGLLSTRLGDTALLPSEIFDGRDLWLGVKAGADAEAVPRQYLAPVAYALRAETAGDAESLGGLQPTDLAPASHTHDAAELATGALDEARIPETIARAADVAPAAHDHDGRYVPTTGPAEIEAIAEAPSLTIRQYGPDVGALVTAYFGHGLVASSDGLANGVAGVFGSVEAFDYAFTSVMGVRGESSSGYGVGGASRTGYGVFGASTNGTGIRGTGAGRGVQGDTAVSGSDGVGGHSNSSTGTGAGVRGVSVSVNGRGVSGSAPATSGTNYGVLGESASSDGHGVYGFASAGSGTPRGVSGYVSSPTGTGVYGYASSSTGLNFGVFGSTPSTSGIGMRGAATATTGSTVGVSGLTSSSAGRGVIGNSSATNGSTYGVLGTSASTNDGAGVRGDGAYVGVWGQSAGKWGVYGRSSATQGYGVFGASTSSDADHYAGYFSGKVAVTGILSKGGGAFRIDHPLDPANKYLQHSFVESPDMMNVYNGNTTLDDTGAARVELPGYFEALNRDFRYQLTPIGAAAPNLHVAREIADNHFEIAGGASGLKVSWQVTGIRKDPFAEANRIEVETDKPKDKQGAYLHPEAWGLGPEKGLHALDDPGAAR